MISPWMKNGDLFGALESSSELEDSTRLNLVRLQNIMQVADTNQYVPCQLWGVANGLQHRTCPKRHPNEEYAHR